MVTLPTLIKDPDPGGPTTGTPQGFPQATIFTDMWNAIVDLISGDSTDKIPSSAIAEPAIAIMGVNYDGEKPDGGQFLALSNKGKFGNETDAQTPMPRDLKFRNMTVSIKTNNSSSASTWVLRINSANGNQIINIPAGVAGEFTDTVNTDSILQHDQINYQYNGDDEDVEFNGSSIEVVHTDA